MAISAPLFPQKPATKMDWGSLGWACLFFWYLSSFTHLLIQLTDSAGFKGFRQASLMSLLWVIPLLFFPRYTRILSGGIGLVLWATSLVGLGYFCIYGQEFSQSVIFILFESNATESAEYLDQYFAWWIPCVFLAYSLAGWLLWRRIRPIYAPNTVRIGLSLTIVLGLFVYPVASGYLKSQSPEWTIGHLMNRMEPAVPWQLLFGYTKYHQQNQAMQQLLTANAAIPPLKNLKDIQANAPSTIVLVIGESTNRERMSLYGYHRPTTPGLDALRGQLDVFDNVITPRPYTIEALEQVLTFADPLNPDLHLTTPSVVNLMKQAGYKTFWITNQQTMTKRNTMLTAFSEQADEQVYLNHNRNQNARQYDDEVLAPFADKLNDPAPRKFIVVHLLGTHMGYRYRYPQNEEYFATNSREGVPEWVDETEELAFYNQYDNAVRFNDYVVSSLIKHFAATDPNGFLVYLSDHGESVFDEPKDRIPGRNEASPTAAMYTIPFILWRSPQWQANHPQKFRHQLHRLYSSANFIHTLSDLAGLRFDEQDLSKSLVSPSFKTYPVLIGDPYKPNSLMEFTRLHLQPNQSSQLTRN